MGRNIIHLLLTHATQEDNKLLPSLEKNKEILDF
jgi:hypothetical protein